MPGPRTVPADPPRGVSHPHDLAYRLAVAVIDHVLAVDAWSGWAPDAPASSSRLEQYDVSTGETPKPPKFAVELTSFVVPLDRGDAVTRRHYLSVTPAGGGAATDREPVDQPADRDKFLALGFDDGDSFDHQYSYLDRPGNETKRSPVCHVDVVDTIAPRMPEEFGAAGVAQVIQYDPDDPPAEEEPAPPA
jgi:hypothetical protein